MKRGMFTAALALAALTVGMTSAQASPTVAVYNARVTPLPANQVSEAFEATSASEIGDQITLDGTARKLNVVTITMSSWACVSGSVSGNDCATPSGATFTVPITLNIYGQSSVQNDGTVTPGALLTRVTKNFKIPYRPSANINKCNNTNNSLGKWWDSATHTCNNGKAANIAFDFTSLKLTLPDTVVIGVALNTSDYGYNPVGHAACYTTPQGCPYDSLNLALSPTVAIGTKQYPDTAFQNTSWSGALCDGTPALGEFNLDSPTTACWAGYNPAISVTAH